MAINLRKSPPICLFLSLTQLLIRRLQLLKKYKGKRICMHDKQKFTIFRHISNSTMGRTDTTVVFIVRFRFAKLSHKANKIASVIPMFLITGYPGFHTKIYAVNHENGYWQGMYQWKSKHHLTDYKKSFVYRMMNKRAIKGSITEWEFEDEKLSDFINRLMTDKK